jgi:RnfABCDGE-type electron transport complex G subunit
MVIVLTSVGLVSGSFLATVGILTKERIALNRQREIEKAITEVIPGTLSSQKMYEEKDLTIYGGTDENNTLLGYAILSSGVGFQDKITFMLGTNSQLTRITSLTIIEQNETPGLGAKITNWEFFLKFWEDRNITGTLSLHKPAASSPDELRESEVNTITGATISSEAVLNTVNTSLLKVKQLKKEGRLLLITEQDSAQKKENEGENVR